MKCLQSKIRSIITEECQARGIGAEHIQFGCEHAEYVFEQNKSLALSVKSGIAVAEGQQIRANNHNRSILR